MWPTDRSLSMSFPRSLQILVLLDIMLPELDGFEVCRRIKENADDHSDVKQIWRMESAMV